jgi:hypothetical protein
MKRIKIKPFANQVMNRMFRRSFSSLMRAVVHETGTGDSTPSFQNTIT